MSASDALLRSAWPLSRIGEAITELARASGLAVRHTELGQLRPAAAGPDLSRQVEALGTCLGVELEPVEAGYGELDQLLQGAPPCLIRLPQEQPVFLAVVRQRGDKLVVLAPDRRPRRVARAVVLEALSAPLRAPVAVAIDTLLEDAAVAPARRPRARQAILRERLGQAPVEGVWLLRLPPSASFWQQMTRARLPRHLVTFFVAHLAGYLFMLASWWVIGRAALDGRLDPPWLIAWVLLLLTGVPLAVIATAAQGQLAIGLGAQLKLRLLGGALRLDPEEIRSQGAGQLLGRVIESTQVEALALSAGFNGLVALIELAVAAGVLVFGPGGTLRLLLFGGWIVIILLLARRYYRRRRAWTASRLQMTNDLVERMVGHRTRLAQEPAQGWHEGEDQALAIYLEESRRLDRLEARYYVLLSRGWLLLGLIGLVPPVVLGQTQEPVAVAVALGGVLLAARALYTLGASLVSLTGAAVAWEQVSPLFHAAARTEPPGAPDVVLALAPASGPANGQPVLEATDLTFGYRPTGSPVLDGCTLAIHGGERVLLEGPSGGGKTTLAALLVGLRHPQSGLLLLGGLDRQTLGAAGWRQRVVAAPQFHENHVLTGTFAFNVLLGRDWPATAEELTEAEALCRELGLGPLLDRMPAGLLQVVGETGWRLSHGERSRLYMARALLQGAELVVLDESFAALDPASLRQCLNTALHRAPTLMVIAHP